MGPQQVGSCLDCYAWGATRHHGWRCIGCEGWRGRRALGTCCSCNRTSVPLAIDGACRLCRKQRSRAIKINQLRSNLPDVTTTSSAGQQLFFADMFLLDGPRIGHRGKQPPRPSLPDVDLPTAWRQEPLFAWPRNLRVGRQHGFPEPPDPQILYTVLGRVDAHGARHGWTASHTSNVRGAMRILLGLQQTPGAPIRASEIRDLAQLGYSVPAVTAVLTDTGMFDDDLDPPIVTWFVSQTAQLPAQIRAELGVWFDVMRNGSPTPPRRLPRREATIVNQLSTASPTIRHWASHHASLREVTRDDIKAALPAGGWQRSLLLQAFRSIFRILKGRQVVFVNPTTHMHAAAPDYPIPDPVDLGGVRAAVDDDQPARALIAALLSYHAIRVLDLRVMHTTDIHDGRLRVDRHTIPLAVPVRACLAAYLDYRNTTWPNTINPHLFINRRSATHTRPVNTNWFRDTLGIPPQAVRRDRILDEAIATGGDLRQLTDMFDIHVATAYRYTQIADRARTAERAGHA
jgi:hypothetical protein